MKKGYKQILIDTNLLVYLYTKTYLKRQTVKNLIIDLVNKEYSLFIAQQSLLEFYSVITDKKRVEKPVSSQEAQEEIARYYRNGFFKLIYPNNLTFDIFLKIIDKRKIKGGNVFDFYLAATALSNKINLIYTENVKDFKNIKELEVINPLRP